MELRPPSGPLPELFRPVRERHPDLDVVLLPERPPVPEGPPGAAGEAALAADREAVALALDALVAVVTGARPGVDPRIAFGPREETVCVRARHADTLAESPTAALTAHLAREGWELARPASDHEVLLGRRDGLEVTASYAAATGVATLTVTSAARDVGVARARELVRS